MENEYQCSKCGVGLDGSSAYEYRGVFSCAEHFDAVCDDRDRERQEIIREEDQKTEKLKGLDLASSNPVGKANQKLMARHIEVAGKESYRLKSYEGRLENDR